MKLKILNTKEVKNLKKIILNQWGSEADPDYVFLKNEKGRIFIVNRDFGNLDTENIRIQSVGIYFGELKMNELRLSIEGSQIIGPSATKNVIILSDKEAKQWMAGEDIDKEIDNKGFVIIKHADFIGTGKVTQDRILNYVPKERRINP